MNSVLANRAVTGHVKSPMARMIFKALAPNSALAENVTSKVVDPH
jgi:hypothetical protein